MRARLTLLAPVTFLVIGLGSCRKDANPTPQTGIQRDSLNMRSLTLRHFKCADPRRTIEYGLVAYYPFSGNADDWSGHGYNGIVTGATLTSGKSGHKNLAYSFNGTSDYIVLPFSYGVYGMDTVAQFSIYARVKRGSNGVLFSSGDYYRQSATSLGVSSDSASIHISLSWQRVFINPWGHLGYGWGGASGSLTLSSKDAWEDIAITFDNSVLKIYIDNRLVNSSNQVLWPTLHGNLTGLQGFLVGANTTFLEYGGFLNGVVDEMRFYTRPLTPAEIDYLYKH